MYTNLLLYRNELKNKSIYKYKLIGIITELIFSKKIFKHNSDIAQFIKSILGIELKNYILKSRTMIVAKVCRIINDKSDYTLVQKQLYRFVCEIIEKLKNEDNIKEAKNDFDGWIK